VATTIIIAVNNRVRKRATPLSLVSTAELMGNQHAAFGRSSHPLPFPYSSCCRSMPSACNDLAEVYLIETCQQCPSSQNTMCSTQGPIPACTHECRTRG